MPRPTQIAGAAKAASLQTAAAVVVEFAREILVGTSMAWNA
jgi:hypothetical protein